MKQTIMAATLTLAAIARAQSQSMPGMDMSKPAAMSGMDMPPSKPPSPQGAPTCKNMQGMHGDTPMNQNPSQAPQNGSITHDTQQLQEPENPTHRTGSDVPAPDLLPNLLTNIVTRQPINL